LTPRRSRTTGSALHFCLKHLLAQKTAIVHIRGFHPPVRTMAGQHSLSTHCSKACLLTSYHRKPHTSECQLSEAAKTSTNRIRTRTVVAKSPSIEVQTHGPRVRKGNDTCCTQFEAVLNRAWVTRIIKVSGSGKHNKIYIGKSWKAT